MRLLHWRGLSMRWPAFQDTPPARMKRPVLTNSALSVPRWKSASRREPPSGLPLPVPPSRSARIAALGAGSLTLREQQKPPKGDWKTWLLLGGRGSGKTHAGSHWVNGIATGLAPFADVLTSPIALIGETLGDVREVMIEGPAGIIACSGLDRPVYEPTRRRLVWPNGAIAQAFSAHDPESLRGPQFSAAWCDELMKWPHATDAWDMLQFGLRLGDRPRVLVTTTPRPLPLLGRLMASTGTVTMRMRTDDNAGNLAPGFVAAIRARYGKSALGRQELDAEIVAQRDNALWNRTLIDRLRSAPGDLVRIVVAVDPPAGSKATSDACGIIAAGIDGDGIVHVLADATIRGARPDRWAMEAAGLYAMLGADRLVAEVNQGGDMVTSVIAAVDPAVHVVPVHARKSKYMRAEPVAALYAQHRVRHAGRFDALEDEMCDFGVDGLSSGRSPDRLDALVWAVADLAGQRSTRPRLRRL